MLLSVAQLGALEQASTHGTPPVVDSSPWRRIERDVTLRGISPKLLQACGIALAAVGVTTLALSALRDLLTLANFSLLYLLVVLLIAIQYGVGPSLLAAVASFLCFNYFLVQPLYTFAVADPRDVLDLIVFLVVAMLTGQLAARVRLQAEAIRQRAAEQEILYKLTSAFNQLTSHEGVYEALKRVLREDLAARTVNILPASDQTAPSGQTTAYLLLRTADQIYGTLSVTFSVQPTPTQIRLANTCTAQAAMALQRIDLSERARQSAALGEADRLKTALLRAVSHDLRTPITIIKTSASNLLNLYDSLSQEERSETLAAINSEADQLNKMVGNLLDMSRLQAGALQLNSRLNSLEEVAGDVAARIWQLTGEERIKIDFPEDMPLVPFDYGLILQALINLVDNSLRYAPENSKVEIRGSMTPDEARVAIINHGPTISPEEHHHIMEPFYHGRDGHIGLGLPIAKGIIEAHHGRLWLEDTPGGGATFVTAFPLTSESVTHHVEDTGC